MDPERSGPQGGTLFTPWRLAYIQEGQPAGAGCFFCAAAERPDEPERLAVWRGEHHVVLLNRYPYSSGHLMVAPRRHQASPQEASGTERAAFWPLILRAQRVLERVYAPHGLNLGLNLGRAAGAGVLDHWHFHLVPRWLGDANFMTAVGGARLVPEEPAEAWVRLRAAFAEDR